MQEPIIRNPLALNDDALGENFPEVPNPKIHCAESVSQADGLGDESTMPE